MSIGLDLNKNNDIFINLPEEIITKIFGYLPYSDLNSCRKVNSQFRRIGSDSSLFLGRQKYDLLHSIFDKFVALTEEKKIVNQLLQKSFIGFPDESDIVINTLKNLKFSELGDFLPEDCNRFNYNLIDKCRKLLNLASNIFMYSMDKKTASIENRMTACYKILNENVFKKCCFKILSLFLLKIEPENDWNDVDFFQLVAKSLFDYKFKYKSQYACLKKIVDFAIESILKNDNHSFYTHIHDLFKKKFFLGTIIQEEKKYFIEQSSIRNYQYFINFLQDPERESKLSQLNTDFFNLFQTESFFEFFKKNCFQTFHFESGEEGILSLFSKMISAEHSSAELLMSFILNDIINIDLVDEYSKNSKNHKISGLRDEDAASSNDKALLFVPKTTLEFLLESIVNSIKVESTNLSIDASDSFLKIEFKIHLLYLLDEPTFLNIAKLLLEKASLMTKSETKLSFVKISFLETLMNSLCSPLIKLYNFPIAKQLLNEFPGYLSIKTMKRLAQSLFSGEESPVYQLVKCFSYNPPHAISLLGELTYETNSAKFQFVEEFLKKMPNYRDWSNELGGTFHSAQLLYTQGEWLMSFLLGNEKNEIEYNDNFQRFLSISELVLQKFPKNICEGIKSGLYNIEDQNLLNRLCLTAFAQLKLCENSLCLLEKSNAFSEVIRLLKSNPSFFYSNYFCESNLPKKLVCNDLLNVMFKEYIKNRSSNLEIKSIVLILHGIFKKYHIDNTLRFESAKVLIRVVGGRLAHHNFKYFNIDNPEDMEKLYIYTFEKFPQNTNVFSTKKEKKWIIRNVVDENLSKKILDRSIETFNAFKESQKRKLAQGEGEEPPAKKRKKST